MFPKVYAGLGFLFGLIQFGLPVAVVLYVAGFFTLRRRLRVYRETPSASTLKHALDAVGSLTIAVLGIALTLVVLTGVVDYKVYSK